MGILSKKEEADWGLEQRQQQSLCIWPAICICTLWARSVAVSSVSNGGKEVRLGSVSASKSPQWENSMPSTHRVLFPSSLCILTHACARIHTHTHKYVDKYYRNNSQSKVYAQLPLVSLLEILAAHPHSTSVKQTPRPHHSLSVNPHTLLLVIFLSTWSQLRSSEKRDPQMRNYLHYIGLWPCLWAFSWETIDMEEPSLLWAVPPEHTVLSCTKRKLAEQAVGRKPVRSTSLWFLPEFMTWFWSLSDSLWPGNYKMKETLSIPSWFWS